MKRIKQFLVVLLLSINIAFAQKSDSVSFSKVQVINIYNNVRSLKYRDSTNRVIIDFQQAQLELYSKLAKSDSIIIHNKTIESDTLRSALKTCKEVKTPTKLQFWHIYSSIALGMLTSLILFK